MSTLTLTFDSAELQKAETVAKERGTSLTDMFRRLVSDYARISDSEHADSTSASKTDGDAIVSTMRTHEDIRKFFNSALSGTGEYV